MKPQIPYNKDSNRCLFGCLGRGGGGGGGGRGGGRVCTFAWFGLGIEGLGLWVVGAVLRD